MTTTQPRPDPSDGTGRGPVRGAASTDTAIQVVPVLVAQPGIRRDLQAVKVVMHRELIRFAQDRLRFVSALIQPILFLFVLGTGLSSLTDESTGGVDLRTFLFPGILATSTMFTAVFAAVSIVWDREFGFLREMLVAPVRRGSIILGKILGGATVATLQSIVILLLAPLVDVPLDPLQSVVILGEIFLLSFMLTAMGLVVVARIQQIQTVMGIMQMMILPLSFLSGALYPVSDDLPRWMATLIKLNPVTYAVQPVRTTAFKSLDAPQSVIEQLNPPITWGGWVVPIGVQLAIVVTVGLVFMGIAVKEFQRVE